MAVTLRHATLNRFQRSCGCGWSFRHRASRRAGGWIERFFRTVDEMFLCDLDGYTRRSRRSASLSIEQLEALFRSWLIETYHRRRSFEGRLCPKERWEESGFLPRMPDRLNNSICCLCTRCARKVRPDGIHLQGAALPVADTCDLRGRGGHDPLRSTRHGRDSSLL